MVSLYRTVRSIYRVGVREWWRQMQYIGDAKSGRLVGADQFGNRYYENLNAEEEIPGRHRWVDLAQTNGPVANGFLGLDQHEYNASQVPPEWHSWISHIRNDPPNEDKAIQKYTPPWKSPYMENLTGTRGAYRPYNTVAPKINSWAPQTVAQRRNGSASAAAAASS